MGHTRTALRVQMACSKHHVNSYLQQIAYSEIHFSRGGGGGATPRKKCRRCSSYFKGDLICKMVPLRVPNPKMTAARVVSVRFMTIVSCCCVTIVRETWLTRRSVRSLCSTADAVHFDKHRRPRHVSHRELGLPVFF